MSYTIRIILFCEIFVTCMRVGFQFKIHTMSYRRGFIDDGKNSRHNSKYDR